MNENKESQEVLTIDKTQKNSKQTLDTSSSTQSHAPYFHHNKRTVSSGNISNRSHHHHHRQSFHRTQTESSNLNNYKQPAPFQPASYHHNTNLIIDKYNRKFNLISFILLRKYDNFINEEKVYLNDQLLYNLIKNFIQNFDCASIMGLYKQNNSILNHKNSYNSSLFIYTIREALEYVSSKEKSETSEKFLENLLNFLFENELPNDISNINDGDYPMRNIMHYSARYNCVLMLKLLFKHVKSNEIEKLCLSTDYTGNTPLHVAVQHNSEEFIQYLYENLQTLFKQINFDYAYNYDGFNLVLLACKYSSLNLIKYLHEVVGLSVNLKELNPNSLKTCIHLAILRTVDKAEAYLNTFKIIKYLYDKNKYLAYELSPLVGSIYHIAASNLTRIHILWFFLNEYDEKYDKISVSDNERNQCVNSVDFREYSCIDCFIETLINIRAIIPKSETIYSFYKKYFYKTSYENADTLSQIYFNDETSFNLLINKCLFKLIAKCKAKITKLPQIKTQIELYEFIKLLKFMSKFHFKLQTKFDSIYYTKFEAFCLKFLNTFIFTGDLLPTFSTNVDIDQNNNSIQQQQMPPPPVDETFLNIFSELIELTRIIINSGFFTIKFQQKVYSFMCDYFTNLNQQYDKFSSNDSKHTPKLLEKFLNELNLMNKKMHMQSLKDICRYEINYCLFNSVNDSHLDSIYFSLPTKNYDLINYLTFNLLNDLFGANYNDNDQIISYI